MRQNKLISNLFSTKVVDRIIQVVITTHRSLTLEPMGKSLRVKDICICYNSAIVNKLDRNVIYIVLNRILFANRNK